MFETFSPEQIEIMLSALSERLGKEEFEHSLMCAETCTQLAQIYGADLESAFVAGLLHDWDKELEPAELLARAEDFGIEIDDYVKAHPKLLHEKTGALAAREFFLYESSSNFDIGDRVVKAISRHTLAATDMHELDMIVYISDMIEPYRDYEGVEDLREMVGTVSLETLFMQALEKTVHSLLSRRRLIHPRSIEVWNSYTKKGERS